MKISKELATKVIIKCAREYHNHLENQNLLIVFGSPSKPNFFETVFFSSNFLHLTGVKPTSNEIPSSNVFYQRALSGVLTPHDFAMAENGTTEKKLSVLPRLTKFYTIAKMVGDYNSIRSMLYTEKLAGNTTACLGFVFQNGFYIPNTALEDDMRNLSLKPTSKILAIFRKPTEINRYQEICYLAKGIDINAIALPHDIKKLLAIDSIEHAAKTFSETKTSALQKAAAVHNKANQTVESKSFRTSDIEI
jgi:hypothetical protein